MSLSQPLLAEPPAMVPSGLTSEQAASRLERCVRNEVAEERESLFKRVAKHFWAPVPWMLEATIVLQFSFGERIEAGLITALLVFNVLLGVVQESRADAALALLKQRLMLKARVCRNGKWTDLLAPDLVPEDVVRLSLGAIVPADVRIVTGSVLLDQSMLTGESIPTEAGSGVVAYAGALVRRGSRRDYRDRSRDVFWACGRVGACGTCRKRRGEGGRWPGAQSLRA